MTSRRAEYAAATKLAIQAAARELFLAKGYVATTVDEIATLARVAPATVYAVGGGKQKLLQTVVEQAVSTSTASGLYEQLDAAPDPDALLRLIITITRTKFDQWRDVMRVVTATAGHEPAAAEALQKSQAAMRHGFERTAQRLATLNALRPDVDTTRATDLLWFYLGNAAYYSLTEDNGWSLDATETWLHPTLRHALLR